MKGILLPEIVINNTLLSIIRLIRKDLSETTKREDTILYKILGINEEGESIQMNLYNYFNQAEKMFKKPDNLSVNFGYNQEVAKNISLHILLPSEQGSCCIGNDEGYVQSDVLDANGVKIGNQNYLTEMFESTYQILITSSNSSEVNVIYNVLKSMLLMLTSHLELMGLRTPTLSGNDIVMQDNIIPVPMFHKVINLSFKYELNVPQLLYEDIAKRFFLTMKMIDYNSQE